MEAEQNKDLLLCTIGGLGTTEATYETLVPFKVDQKLN